MSCWSSRIACGASSPEHPTLRPPKPIALRESMLPELHIGTLAIMLYELRLVNVGTSRCNLGLSHMDGSGQQQYKSLYSVVL